MTVIKFRPQVALVIKLTLAANADVLSLLNRQMANLGVTNDTTQATTILDLTTRLVAATATHQAYGDTLNLPTSQHSQQQ